MDDPLDTAIQQSEIHLKELHVEIDNLQHKVNAIPALKNLNNEIAAAEEEIRRLRDIIECYEHRSTQQCDDIAPQLTK